MNAASRLLTAVFFALPLAAHAQDAHVGWFWASDSKTKTTWVTEIQPIELEHKWNNVSFLAGFKESLGYQQGTPEWTRVRGTLTFIGDDEKFQRMETEARSKFIADNTESGYRVVVIPVPTPVAVRHRAARVTPQ